MEQALRRGSEPPPQYPPSPDPALGVWDFGLEGLRGASDDITSWRQLRSRPLHPFKPQTPSHGCRSKASKNTRRKWHLPSSDPKGTCASCRSAFEHLTFTTIIIIIIITNNSDYFYFYSDYDY